MKDPTIMADKAKDAVSAIRDALDKTDPRDQKTKGASKKSNSPSPSKRHGKINPDPSVLQAKINSLRSQEAERIEHTPTIGLGDDAITLDFHGKVAGKSAIRKDPVIVADNMGKLRPLLQPIVAVANAALRGAKFDAPERFKEPELRKYVKARSLEKAEYAYTALLSNPKFVEKLDELNGVIKEVYEDLKLEPKDVAYAARAAKDLDKRFGDLSELKALRNAASDPLNPPNVDGPDDDNDDLGLT